MKPLAHSLLLLLLLLLLPFSACLNRGISPDLLEIRNVAQGPSPLKAIAMLDSIDPDKLTEQELYFCDLLRLKVAYNAERFGLDGYAVMDADTLVQPLLDYVEANPGCGFYPEALLYSGRFYSEIGDSYRALTIFRKALKTAENDSADLPLHRELLSRTGNLLLSMGKADVAEDFFDRTLRLDSILADSLSMIEDRKALGTLHLRDRNYRSARREFETAREIAARVSPADTSVVDIYLAEVDYHDFKKRESFRRIKSAVGNVPDRYLNLALGEAAYLYYNSGYPDTAAVYAMQLSWREEPSNFKIGCGLLMLPGVNRHAPADTINRNFSRWLNWVDNGFTASGGERRREKLMQTSMYNYTVHDRYRMKAEKRSTVYAYVALGAVIVALLLLVIFLVTKSREKQALLNLHEAIEKANGLESAVPTLPEEPRTDIPEDTGHVGVGEVESQQEVEKPQEANPHGNGKEAKDETAILIDRLKASLLARYKDATPDETDYEVPETIVRSEAYKDLRKLVKSGKPVAADSKLWRALDKVVCKAFPEFKRNFTYLAGKRMTAVDYQTALLIKCGLKPSEMAVVFSIEVSSVGSRRSAISQRIYGRNIGSAAIDAIILSL